MSIDYGAMAFPKQSWMKNKKKVKLKKGPKHRKGKSILQDKHDKRCYLCMLLDGDYREKVTEEHHVIGGDGRRQLSDTYGLTVRLCVHHHRIGPAAVQNNKENADLLKRIAQERFMEEYPDEDWMKIFEKNYI